MKLLQVNKLYAPWIGGVETVVRQIMEGLSGADGFSVDTLVCQPKGAGAEEQVAGHTLYRASSFGMALGMPVSTQFFSLFRALLPRYDAVLLHHPFPLGFLAYALFGGKKKLYVWYHSDIIRQRVSGFFFAPILIAALKRADKIFVSNPHLIESSPFLRRLKNKTVVIPFGIEPAAFAATPAIREEADKIRNAFGSPLVVSTGRLVYYKGFEHFVEAAALTPNAHFLIIGSGPLKEKLERRIAELDLQDRFRVIDHVPSIVPYFHAADVFVLPSVTRTEAFGIVLLEAMACGKPCVSTTLGTGTDWVNEDGATGFTVPPKDAQALAGKITALLADGALRTTLGANALAKANRLTIGAFLARLKSELTP